MPKAGALSLASQAKYCGCIKYFPSCRKTKETPHGLRAKDEDEVGLNKLCGHELRQGLCLRSLSRPLSALYIKLFMPGPRLSVFGSYPPDLEVSRLGGARKPRLAKFTYYLHTAACGPHFYGATFCGGIYEKFKTIVWLWPHRSGSTMGWPLIAWLVSWAPEPPEIVHGILRCQSKEYQLCIDWLAP